MSLGESSTVNEGESSDLDRCLRAVFIEFEFSKVVERIWQIQCCRI